MSVRSAIGRRFRRPARVTSAPSPDGDLARVLDSHERDLIQSVQPFTLAGPERILATSDAVAYVVERGVPGALLECGVWRGGSVLAMILTLQRLGVTDRDLYLCDTFAGMSEPTEEDTSRFDPPAVSTFERARAEGHRAWEFLFGDDVFGLEQVQALLATTGYPADRLHYVVGPVEETLPSQGPDAIAVLRLDTDWYTSTKHEMDHLYPRLARGGVLIVDDYGHWEGARRAVDEYFQAAGERPLLARTDYTGRLAIKV